MKNKENAQESPQEGTKKKRFIAPAVAALILATGAAVTSLSDCPSDESAELADKQDKIERNSDKKAKKQVPDKPKETPTSPAPVELIEEGVATEPEPEPPKPGEPQILNSDNTRVRAHSIKAGKEEGFDPENLKVDTMLFDCDTFSDEEEGWKTRPDGVQWVSQDAHNLRIDNENFQEGEGSFAFDLDPKKANMGDQDGQEYGQLNFYFWNPGQTKDLSEYSADGVISFWVNVPDKRNFEHVQVYVGANEQAFVVHTVNDKNLSEGWNFVQIPLETELLANAGVDISHIGYMAMIFQGNYAYDETRNDFHVDAIGISHGFQGE